ncbi:hypothetical protein KSP39_PZI010215 [Platanthera zijinensis]|uniref:Calponin-homology (CH) domain-containing protein n=1 Tax=Platanthera zijinensis TaxID=2320716 RepID=A0AAP0BJ24_9ASPA
MWRLAMIGSPEFVMVGHSSPDSAETSFRELDDVFLQTQTRIWLGEVLHVRLDKDVGIADILADGELLFQVSKKVWKMLLNKYGEQHSKMHIYDRTSSGKSEGKYTPYPKVDSFLKICQILGLTGIDLFSPTDAVDKRDVRRVCMCIRSLSKKARVKKLEVPDFDIVTCNVLMPTNLVGGICRNLELSQYSSSASNASSPEVFGLKNLFVEHSQVSDSGFDEVESFIDLEFESPLLAASYDAAHVTDIVEETSHVLSSVDDKTLHETCFKNSIQDRNHYEHVDEHLDELLDESIGSCYSSTRETDTIPSSSIIENDCPRLIQSDDRYYRGQQKCRRDSIDTLISSSFNGSEFECYSSSRMRSTCIVEHIEDQEKNVSKSNFMIDFSEAVINTSSRLKSDTEVSSEVDDAERVDVTNHSCINFSQPNSMRESSMSKDLDVLRVSESSEIFACSAFASERIPNFDFCWYDLFVRSRNNLEIKSKSFQIVDVLPISIFDFREGREAASDENFSAGKQVVPRTHVTFAEPNNATQAILDTTVYQKDAIITDELCKNKHRDGRTVRNRVLKSVAGIITLVGALALLLHVSGQRKGKEKNNETVVPLLVQKQNQELFIKRKVNMGKSNSPYLGEKLKF